MSALLGSAVLGILFYFVRKHGSKPLWPALGFALLYTAILFATQAGPISNVAGGAAAGILCYVFFRVAPEIQSGVGTWGIVFSIFIVPTVALTIANKVASAIEAMWVAAGRPGAS